MPDDLIPYRGRPLSRQDRRAATVLREAQLPAKRATARIQAASIAAHSGLICIEVLTNLEVQMVKRGGAAVDDRVKAVVDCYAGLVTTELARLSLGE